MSLMSVERTKLMTTRSPWWCLAAALVVSLGFAILFSSLSGTVVQGGPRSGETLTLDPALVVTGVSGIGLYIIMIMAALAVTTEYRFGVIRTTFLAAPHRSVVIGSKAAFLGLVGLVVGEVLAFGSYGFAKLINSDLGPISTQADWRAVAGIGIVYALGSVLAVAVGTLLRQSAGAIALLVLFPLLVEQLVQLIPTYGRDVYEWMPFVNAGNFLGTTTLDGPLGPWGSLAYFAAVVAVVLVAALVVVDRRDA